MSTETVKELEYRNALQAGRQNGNRLRVNQWQKAARCICLVIVCIVGANEAAFSIKNTCLREGRHSQTFFVGCSLDG